MDPLDVLTLASLPTDIIRIIVHMEQAETVDRWKLISPGWNSIALDFLSDRDRLPPIDKVFCNANVDSSPFAWLQGRYQHYFGLQTLAQCLRESEINVICRMPWANERIALFFRRASRIEKLELHLKIIYDNEFDLYSTWLDAVTVRNLLVVHVNTFNRESIIHFLRVHNVLYFKGKYVSLHDYQAGDFILHAMQYVKKIDIYRSIPEIQTGYWDTFIRILNNTGQYQASLSNGIIPKSRISVIKITN